MNGRTALVLSPDPYLAFLLEGHPEDFQLTLGDSQMRVASIIDAAADLVVCESDDPRVRELRTVLGQRLVLVADADARTTDPRVIRRPLSAEEVQRAVELPLHAQRGVLEDPIGALIRHYPWGLVLAGLVAVATSHLRGATIDALLLSYVVVAYGLARRRLTHDAWWYVDLLVTALVTALHAGVRGPFAVLTFVVAGGIGLRVQSLRVALAGGLLGGAAALGAEWFRPTGPDVFLMAQTTLIVVLVALLAATGSERATGGAATQDRLGAVLRELRVLARSDPDALRVPDVARTALRDVLGALGVERGMLLLHRDGALQGAASTLDTPAEDLTLSPNESRHLMARRGLVMDSDDLPRALTADIREDRATITPLIDHDLVVGVVVAAGAAGRPARRTARRLANDAAGRLANATSFARLMTDTVDQERRRLAGELHDSTAQVLAHVRLELQLLARAGGPHTEELQRLARVSGRAQDDLRTVIRGLRAEITDEGLAGSLRAYIADLRSRSGPGLRFTAHSAVGHHPEVEREVFRIAQEAISNAVRHAAATSVTVHLEADEAGIALTVDDDGKGMVEGAQVKGLGLQQMRERADRLGAEFDVASNVGGTRLTLRVPATGVVSGEPVLEGLPRG